MMRVGITIGDPAGIGPEIVLKSLNKLRKIKGFKFVILTPENFFQTHSQSIELRVKKSSFESMMGTDKKLQILEVTGGINFEIGKPSSLTGNVAFSMVKKGIELALDKKIDALVTAPVSKYAINLTGRKFTGHTEMLKRISKVKDVLMFFVSPALKTGLVTTHIRIKNVSSNLSKENILSKIEIMNKGLKNYFNVLHPVIGVSALNPHAGEHGFIGKEETDIIEPTIRKAAKKGINVEGPLPSDTILLKRKNFDAILFMYHDQAMIAAKLLSWEKNVNVTLGLPFVRTSPDHGTAFDIAGLGIASPRSFMQAVRLACHMLRNKR